MTKTAAWVDLGLMEYQQAYALQTELVEQCRTNTHRIVFLVLEHPPVFTLGRRGGQEHLVVPQELLKEKNIDLIHIERGGEVTYHGPGQIIVYPIFHLRKLQLSVSSYVHQLEEVMLLAARDVGVLSGRDERNHGIWVGNKKMGSIGIAIRHGVTFHGLGLNVATDLTPFSWINPCGLTNTKMTSISAEKGSQVSVDQVKQRLFNHCSKTLQLTFTQMNLQELGSFA
ncbi:MAG: octanoyltransferase [Desulfobulbus propionicus]|nr:MAG: octanoyltransferase [Desulfobulbus propionicus]